MSKKARVPQFGKWESEGNQPYTQYFEVARKEKIEGKMINPNDPQENPESFNNPYSNLKDVDTQALPSSPPRSNAQRNANRVSIGSERSFEQSPLHNSYQDKYGERVGMNSPSLEKRGRRLAPNIPLERSRAQGDGMMASKGATVPRFGDWDEKNPSTADGYTHIFEKVREDRQVGTARATTKPNEPAYGSNRKNGYEKKGCCFGFF